MFFINKTFVLFFTSIVLINVTTQEEESVVPQEDIEEALPPEATSNQLPQTALDEYKREHPDVLIMPGTEGANKSKTKMEYNMFGDVVSVPITPAPVDNKGALNSSVNQTRGGQPLPPQPPSPQQLMMQQMQPPFPPPPIGYQYPNPYSNPYSNPYPNPYQNPYAMNPMYNQYNQMMGQQAGYGPQGQFMQQGMVAQPMPPMVANPSDAAANDSVGEGGEHEVVVSAEDLEKYMQSPQPEEEGESQINAENEMNNKMMEILKMNGTVDKEGLKPGTNNTNKDLPINGTNKSLKPPVRSQLPIPPPLPLPMPPPMIQMPNIFPMPFQPLNQFGVNPYLSPNQFKIDRKGMQLMSMPLPNGAVMDPNILRQLQSGRAQLDMNNARIIPLNDVTTEESEEETTGTESLTMENRPELPEVVLPVPKHTKKVKKIKRKIHKKRKHLRRHPKNQPKFLMRARLNNLPKKNDTAATGDQWWTKPVDKHCTQPIWETTHCRHKHLQKRWSFNKSDEKCYLYEDNCAHLKKNTFKSLKECMYSCWRPK